MTCQQAKMAAGTLEENAADAFDSDPGCLSYSYGRWTRRTDARHKQNRKTTRTPALYIMSSGPHGNIVRHTAKYTQMTPIFSSLRFRHVQPLLLLIPRTRLYIHYSNTNARNNPKPPDPHEGTETPNIPYNPPGIAQNSTGSGPLFSFTRFPLFDALLTTFIGLGAGKYPLIQSIWQQSINRRNA